MATTAQQERIHLFKTFRIGSGSHKNFNEGACAIELVSYVAGEPWSDHPECVCPVLGAFFRAWNDGLPDDDHDAVLKPFLPRLIGTNGGAALAERRALMAADWLVRTHTPAWLRLAKLDAQAAALEALPEITAMAQVPSIRGAIEAACNDATAAWAAANAAARDAASDASRDAASAAARAAARDAASDAALAAARDALKPTRDALIKSAAELVERMLSVEEAA